MTARSISSKRVAIVVMTLLMCLSSRRGDAQEPSTEEFWQNQVVNGITGIQNPAAANARVRSIWMELVMHSKHMFPVYPSQQFTAGQATIGGIYLDLSIAADPSVEVTRFFLAHEWGHMMHGDPLNQFVAIGQYRMLVGPRAVEDKADTYAATFMRYQHHDIRPVLEFLCAIPDAGPADPHSSRPDRAKHVAATYGVPDQTIKVPCAEDDEDSSTSSAQLESGIGAMAE